MYFLQNSDTKEGSSQQTSSEDLKNISSEQLIAGIRHGGAPHESEFYRRYYQQVLKFIRSYTNHKAHAEDVAQNAMMIVLLRLRSNGIENPAKLSAYVFQTAKYSYYGGLRSAANRYQSHVKLAEVETSPDSEDIRIRQERRRLVNQLISRMEIPRDREILQRTYTYDESKDSICKALCLTSAHFDCVIDRARKRFRLLLDSESTEVQVALAS